MSTPAAKIPTTLTTKTATRLPTAAEAIPPTTPPTHALHPLAATTTTPEDDLEAQPTITANALTPAHPADEKTKTKTKKTATNARPHLDAGAPPPRTPSVATIPTRAPVPHPVDPRMPPRRKAPLVVVGGAASSGKTPAPPPPATPRPAPIVPRRKVWIGDTAPTTTPTNNHPRDRNPRPPSATT